MDYLSFWCERPFNKLEMIFGRLSYALRVGIKISLMHLSGRIIGMNGRKSRVAYKLVGFVRLYCETANERVFGVLLN